MASDNHHGLDVGVCGLRLGVRLGVNLGVWVDVRFGVRCGVRCDDGCGGGVCEACHVFCVVIDCNCLVVSGFQKIRL